MVHNIRLFPAEATSFTTMGIGSLYEAISCTVSEELNGEYKLEMEYPITGARFKDIKKGMIIVTKPNPHDDPQAFVIVDISITLDSTITINAEHISYNQTKYPVQNLDSRSYMYNQANKVIQQAEMDTIQQYAENGVRIFANTIENLKTWAVDTDILDVDYDSLTESLTGSQYKYRAELYAGQRMVFTDPAITQIVSDLSHLPRYVINNVVTPLINPEWVMEGGVKKGIEFTTPLNSQGKFQNGYLMWNRPTSGGREVDGKTYVKYKYKTMTLSYILNSLSEKLITPDGMVCPFKIQVGWQINVDSDPDINPDVDPDNLLEDMQIKEVQPLTLRNALVSKIAEKYQIEFKFDNFNTIVYGKKGRGRRFSETGYTIRYGKNLIDLEKKIGNSESDEYTKVYPYWYSSRLNAIKTLIDYTDSQGHHTNNSYGLHNFVPIVYEDGLTRPENIYIYDLSSEYNSNLAPSGDQMVEKTEWFIRRNDMNHSKTSYDVSFEDLSRYPEYGETMQKLYDIGIGDEVRVIVPSTGINDIRQCTKAVYNVILGKYTEISLGEPKYGITTAIVNQRIDAKQARIKNTEFSVAMSNAAAGVTTGYKGSAVLLLKNDPITEKDISVNGNPCEIVIASLNNGEKSIRDKDVSMWRWNYAGLSFIDGSSGNGGWNSNSPSDTSIAITNDGYINATRIRTGELIVGVNDPPIMKIVLDPNNPQRESFYLDVKASDNTQLIKVNSETKELILNATSITTGTLRVLDSEGTVRSVIPTVSNGEEQFYIDNNYIKLKNIDATNIVTGTLAVREVRSGGYTAATSAELFDNVTWPAEDHPNTYAKVSNETSITPTGIQNGRWYKSAATFEVVVDLGNYTWEEVGDAPHKYWRMTTQLPDIYTSYATTTVPSLYVYGYKTVAQTAWNSRSDYQCSLLPEGTGKRLVIDNPELRGKTAAYVKSYFTGTKVYYKVVSAAERLTYKWYPNDDYWYWTHFGTTYPNASTGLIDINTRIGSFYISGNALFQGLPGRESRFSENGVFLSTGIAAAYTIGTGVNVRGWCLGIGGKFGVTIEGNLYASNAYIQGRVDADEGYIGGWSIKESGLTALIKDTYSASARYSGLDTTNAEADIEFPLSGAAGSAYIDGNVRFYTGRSENSDYGQVTSLETYVTYAKNNAVISNLAITQDGGLISRKIAILDPTLKSASGGSIRGTYLIFSHKYLTESHIDTSTQRMTGTYAEWTHIIDNVTNTTSDANYKHDITDLTDKYNILFDRLRPVSYKYNNGTSGRDHTGFIAQEVHNAIIAAGLTEKNFAAIITSHEHNDDTGEDIEIMRLRRDEFVALNTWQIQKLKQKVPNPPDEDGVYLLQCSKVNGLETYSWIAM